MSTQLAISSTVFFAQRKGLIKALNLNKKTKNKKNKKNKKTKNKKQKTKTAPFCFVWIQVSCLSARSRASSHATSPS